MSLFGNLSKSDTPDPDFNAAITDNAMRRARPRLGFNLDNSVFIYTPLSSHRPLSPSNTTSWRQLSHKLPLRKSPRPLMLVSIVRWPFSAHLADLMIHVEKAILTLADA